MKTEIDKLFGNIDIYLFDQIAKGRFDHCHSILDAGCGNGRNLHYFSKKWSDLYGVDQSEQAIEKCKRSLSINPDHLSVAKIENLPYQAEQFDAVICCAVLHFADNNQHFKSMINELWRVLKPQGMLFVRLASSIGIEDRIKPLGNNKYVLPDKSTRYLVSEQQLLNMTKELNAELLDSIKTTNVQNLRCMTTWVIKKC